MPSYRDHHERLSPVKYTADIRHLPPFQNPHVVKQWEAGVTDHGAAL